MVKLIALAGLVISTGSPIFTLIGLISVESNQHFMLAGMILWFAGATPWLGRSTPQPSDTELEK